MAEKIGKMLMKAAREMGAEDLRLAQGGKHPRVTGRIGERPFMYVVPSSSSDWRAGRNALCGLRRLLGVERPQSEAKAATGKPIRRKRTGSRTSCNRAGLLPNAAKAPKAVREDRFFAPLAALAEQMEVSARTEDALKQTIAPAGEPAQTRTAARRVPLRTPWLGRKQRFQMF